LTAARHDLLIDLGGHTSSGRPGVFARRCAPLQLGFLGYPTATGLAAMDGRITDACVDPPGAAAGDSEGPLHLPHSYFCYRPPPAPPVAPLPRLGAGHITFGCCNSLSKVSDVTLALWAQVLTAVPDSRLLLKSQGLKDPGTRQRLLARCRRAGLDPARVRLSDWQPQLAAHLGMYGQIDIALDTYPYNGATTTCEALWMGVPVVSLTGATHASRMGLSILSAAGRADWAADEAESYVAVAATLARDAGSLATMRAGLRGSLAGSALMAEADYVRAFEALLRQSASERCAHG
jgi:predicted O-linked N-acetylglucosamine transferase (SPINDLY family)